jgi:hypothetical protein
MAPPPAAPAPAPAEPAPAPAETNVYIEQPPAPVAVVPPAAPVVMTPSRTRLGAGVLVGGGVVDFSRDQARADTGVGGYWDVRAVVGTRTFVGLEAAYHGTAQAIDTLGLSNNAALVGNGVEGALRLNIPIAVGRSLVEPFGFLGMGWSHYNVVNSDTGSASISDPDDVLTAPFGAGFAYGYAGFVADARFTYRPTYYNDLLRTTNGSSDRLDNWSVGGQVGFEF